MSKYNILLFVKKSTWIIILFISILYYPTGCDKATCPEPITKKDTIIQEPNFAIQFDGIDDYLELYLSPTIYNTQRGTVSLWVKVNDLSKSFTIVGMSDRGIGVSPNVFGNDPNQWVIEYRGTDWGQQQIHLSGLKFSNSIRTLSATTPANSINDNNWHNIAVLTDDNGNSIQVYIDGTLQSLTAFCCGGSTNDFFLADVPNLDNTKIGTIHRDTLVTTNAFLMDDFCLWNRALSLSDVQTIYLNPKQKPLNGLLVDYTFNSFENLSIGIPGINDIKDQTGNNHADGVNGPILVTH